MSLFINETKQRNWASLVQMVKNLPAMWETWVWSLSWEDPLEKGTLPTPVFWPGEFHGQRSLTGYSPRGRKESNTTERLTLSKKHWYLHIMEYYPTKKQAIDACKTCLPQALCWLKGIAHHGSIYLTHEKRNDKDGEQISSGQGLG